MVSRATVAGARILALAASAIVLLMGNAILAPQPGYAQAPGPEVCAGCHEEQVKTFNASKHGTKADSRAPVNAGGCILCHGDATEHVKAGGGRGVGGIRNPGGKSMPAEAKNGLCLTCHQGDPQRIHWKDSVHASRADLACTSCHKLHTAHDAVREKITQPQVCFNCHKEQRVQINKPARHPILEGKVSCSDCHNVHGNNPKQMIKGSVVETCYQCHMEKRGPFVHNHQPVTEDCTICHQPHGSTIANLLKSRPPFLCQDCHASGGHPSQFAAMITGRLAPNSSTQLGTVARGCLNCHTNIHGSNSTQDNQTTGRFRR